MESEEIQTDEQKDQETLLDLLVDLEMLKYRHKFNTDKYKDIQGSVVKLLEKIIQYAKSKE